MTKWREISVALRTLMQQDDVAMVDMTGKSVTVPPGAMLVDCGAHREMEKVSAKKLQHWMFETKDDVVWGREDGRVWAARAGGLVTVGLGVVMQKSEKVPVENRLAEAV